MQNVDNKWICESDDQHPEASNVSPDFKNWYKNRQNSPQKLKKKLEKFLFRDAIQRNNKLKSHDVMFIIF